MGGARQLAERYYELFAAGDLDGAKALYADDCITVTPVGNLDNAAHRAFGEAFRNAMPDSRMEVARSVDAGDEVCILGHFKGTHQGDLVSPDGTIAASGRTLDLAFADYFRVADGKIAEQETVFDQMTLLGQLGALGPPPS